MTIWFIVPLFLSTAAAAQPTNFAYLMRGEPEASYLVDKPMYEIERCIVLNSKMALVPYRTPDRPGNSILLYRREQTSDRAVWELADRKGQTELSIWAGSGLFKPMVAQCLR